MKIMATWMTLAEMDGADTRQEYKGRDGQSLYRLFKYRQPFGLHFRYRHQVYDNNNRRHASISIERTWETKFCPDINFAWYLAVTEVNTALADGHFRKGGRLIPTLQFQRKIAHEMMENTIGVDTVDSGRHRRSKFTPAILACTLLNVKKHEGSYDIKAKKSKNPNRNIKNRDVPTLKLVTNELEFFVNAPWASFCAIYILSNIKLRLLLMHKYCNQLVT